MWSVIAGGVTLNDFGKSVRSTNEGVGLVKIIQKYILASIGTVIAACLMATTTHAADKPNILVIWGDDIGWFNISAYNHGMMGYKTPNIDRIANEGAMFTDWYGQQSCTAGRAAFITGQSPIRTGLTKVGLPGAKEGMSEKDPTLAGLLKNHGYATGQFGKNHLGDRDEHLPTNHGFDEFFGNLYHLNAEDEPENIATHLEANAELQESLDDQKSLTVSVEREFSAYKEEHKLGGELGALQDAVIVLQNQLREKADTKKK